MRPAVNCEQASGLISSECFLHRGRCPGRCQYGRWQRRGRGRIRTQSSQSGVVLEDMLKQSQDDIIFRLKAVAQEQHRERNGNAGSSCDWRIGGVEIGTGLLHAKNTGR
jgi:hypothetical protein